MLYKFLLAQKKKSPELIYHSGIFHYFCLERKFLFKVIFIKSELGKVF